MVSRCATERRRRIVDAIDAAEENSFPRSFMIWLLASNSRWPRVCDPDVPVLGPSYSRKGSQAAPLFNDALDYDNRHSAPSILHLLDEVRSQGNVVVLDENLVSLLSENLGGNGGHRAPVCQAAQAALRARSRCSRLEFRSSRTGETAKNSRGHKRASGARSPAAGPTVDC